MRARRDVDIEELITRVEARAPHEPEFLEAIRSTLRELAPMIEREARYRDESLFERLLEPDRSIQFRVEWEDDEGAIRVSRGYRVQWSDALGPYKGGLRFDPSVSSSVLKFLAFEQTFKNALTGLGIGGGKGGADFDPRRASASEVRRFCQGLMIELQRHVGSECDVPAGDIGVGTREIGFLYGQYKKLHPDGAASITGKPLELSGSPLREEATGWGTVYFASHVLDRLDRKLEGRRCVVSGAGNVALHTAEKLIQAQARVLTLSDRSGFIHAPNGLSPEDVELMRSIKKEGGDVSELAESCGYDFAEGRPWGVACDIALPCATQNELDGDDARSLIERGCEFVCEGANMPCTSDARDVIAEAGIVHAPGKAVNAGGVAVSEFEMAQAASRQRWSRDMVDRRLQDVMREIHERCVQYGVDDRRERVDYAAGATRAGFTRVADAMLRL